MMNRVRKKHILLCLLITTFLGSSPFALAAKWIELEKANVHFDMPDKWEAHKKIFGLPLVLKGPRKRGQQPIITVTPSDVTEIFFDKKALKKNQQNYREGRRKWLGEYNGKALKFFPYQVQSWKNAKTVHRVGMRYQLQNQTYEEYSYYFNCQKQLFHIKTVYPLEKFQSQKREIFQLIQSFNCQRKVQ